MSNSGPKRILTVIADYESAYPDPFFVAKGETVRIGKKDSTWPGWIWCTNRGGESRWLPESYLEIGGDTGKVLIDYDSVELTVRVGEQMTVLKEANGWFWCINSRGEKGWVPPESVGILEK